MARDAELDRLKAAQDLAFNRKQDAYDRMQAAWQRREATLGILNKAFETKDRAHAVMDAAWQDLQKVRDRNNPRIEQLSKQQEAAHRNKVRSFDDASAAFNSRNGFLAKTLSQEGHRYNEESQRCVEERRLLIQENVAASDRFNATRQPFERAKSDFRAAKRGYDPLKAAHERAEAEFKREKAAYDRAAAAFRARLEVVVAEAQQRKESRRNLAELARVPAQYLNNVWVSVGENGNTNIYFGGLGEPNGPGHGHYVMDQFGNVTYKREPFEPHGPQNFTDAQRDYSDVILGEIAGTDEFGFRCRFRGFDAYVESNTNRQGRRKIDIYYGPNGPFGAGHHHAVAYREYPLDFIADKLR
jgi:hypothetical protein